jgi:hypothetical protein
MRKTINLSKMIEQSRRYDEGKSDYIVGAQQMQWCEENGSLRVAFEQQTSFDVYLETLPPRYLATKHAMSQLGKRFMAQHLGKGTRSLPLEYINGFPVDFQAQILNRHSQAMGNKSLMFRTYADDNGDVFRAVVSDKYPRVGTTTILNVVKDALTAMNLDTENVSSARSYLSPDDLSLQILTDVVAPTPHNHPEAKNLFLGFVVQENEIGIGPLSVLPLLWRESCTNGLIATYAQKNETEDGEETDAGIRMTHVPGRNPQLMVANMVEQIRLALNASADLAEMFIQSTTIYIPSMQEVLEAIAARKGWSKAVVSSALIGTEGRVNTLDGLINGLTYAAHTNFSANERVLVEQFAGNMLKVSTTGEGAADYNVKKYLPRTW